MELGRCPVVVSDEWVAPAGPEWTDFTLRVGEREISRLSSKLLDNSEEAENLGKKARSAWERYFSWPMRRTYFLGQALELHLEESWQPSFDELYHLWNAKAFSRRYQWHLPGRVRQLAKRKVWDPLCKVLYSMVEEETKDI
jgi:hypothetical protein